MRISDWSSDVCSSDLQCQSARRRRLAKVAPNHRSHAPMRRYTLPLLGIFTLLGFLAAPAWAVDIDGRIDPAEWQGARHVTDFKLVEPLTRAASPYPTEAWVMATPAGLALGFRNTPPAPVPPTHPPTPRARKRV